MMSVKPAPDFASLDFVDVLRSKVNHSGNLSCSSSIFQKLLNFFNFIWAMLMVPMSGTFGSIRSVSRYAIRAIVGLRALIQVIWVHAERIVASMICLLSCCYMSSNFQHQSKPVDCPHFSLYLNCAASIASFSSRPEYAVGFHVVSIKSDRHYGQGVMS